MQQYHDVLEHVLTNGERRQDRTGVGTISVFGTQTRYDLRDGFPAVTTKKLAWRPVVAELLWFLEGSTDERRLAEIQYGKPREELIDKTTIWTANADVQGKTLGYINHDLHKGLGPVYGKQWRYCDGVDQIQNLINGLKNDPYSRRHILNAWNTGQIHKMALPPCHTLIQFNVSGENQLNCQLYQRSADLFLGVPFNVASYALLTHIMADICGLKPGEFVHSTGDTHIYLNHVEQVKEQLGRSHYDLPRLRMPYFTSLEDVLASSVEDFALVDYKSWPSIKAPMAV